MSTAEHWTNWRKSSFSDGGNGDCVEVAWRKSSFSDATNAGNCVEVALAPAMVAVRDSKNPDGPHLHFPHHHWHLLTA